MTVREIADELFISLNTAEFPSAGDLPEAGRELAGRSRRGGAPDDEDQQVARPIHPPQGGANPPAGW